MIDNVALAISHGLILFAAWLLVRRDDLDHEPFSAAKPKRRAARSDEDAPGA